MQIYSWSSPWGALPVAVENGRICAIALDPRAPFAPVGTGAVARRATGPITSAREVNRILNAALRGKLSARERLAAASSPYVTVAPKRTLANARNTRCSNSVAHERSTAASRSRALSCLRSAAFRMRFTSRALLIGPAARRATAPVAGGANGARGSRAMAQMRPFSTATGSAPHGLDHE